LDEEQEFMEESPLILVVDDEEPIVDGVEAWLTMAGYAVITARKGSEAIEKSRQRPPAVAIIDLLLDDMPGLAVINEIHRHSPRTECIVITGRAPERAAVAATEVSAYGYVMKPCNADQLLLVIRRALEHGRTKEALGQSEALAAALLEAAPGAVLVLDRKQKILSLNAAAAALLNKAANEVIDSSLADHLPGEQAEEFEQHCRKALESGNPATLALSIGGRSLRGGIQPLKDTAGGTGRLIVAFEDV